jgi:hypothetical protein
MNATKEISESNSLISNTSTFALIADAPKIILVF